jgi:hypothetical protein
MICATMPVFPVRAFLRGAQHWGAAMDILLLALGLALGAAIGVLATDATWPVLRVEAERAFSRERFARWRSARDRWLPSRLVWAASRLLRLEVLVLHLGVLVVVTVLLALTYSQAALDLLFGALVGVVAAPWIWLHFSRDPDPDAASRNLERYRFLTIALAAVLVLYGARDLVRDWMRRTTQVGAWGLSLTLATRGGEERERIFSLGGGDGASNGGGGV